MNQFNANYCTCAENKIEKVFELTETIKNRLTKGWNKKGKKN